MISITIDGAAQKAEAGERLIDVVNRTGSCIRSLTGLARSRRARANARNTWRKREDTRANRCGHEQRRGHTCDSQPATAWRNTRRDRARAARRSYQGSSQGIGPSQLRTIEAARAIQTLEHVLECGFSPGVSRFQRSVDDLREKPDGQEPTALN